MPACFSTTLEDLAGMATRNNDVRVFSFQASYAACFSTSLEDLAGRSLDNVNSLEDLVGRSLDNVTSLRGAYVAAAAGILQVLELREVVSQIGEILGHAAAHAQVHVVEALRYFLVCVLQHCK